MKEVACLSRPQRLPDQAIYHEDGGEAVENSAGPLESNQARVLSEENLLRDKEERLLSKLSKKSLN